MSRDKPPQREVGGRRLPYEMGSLKFDEDPFRGQRRRPWMCFRIGYPTSEFSSEHFMYVQIIQKLLKKRIVSGNS